MTNNFATKPLHAAHAGRALLISRLMCGSALAGIVALTISAAQAQDQPIESVVVTGTSIRGVAPVGANVISLDRNAIDTVGALSTDQLIQNVPQVSGFGNDGAEFAQSSHSSTGESAPTIHNLGASSSQSTLVLIDGHNFTPSNGYEDPGIIPGIAIQRIDVLADGDSAIYGSNAVAGVINFVTRTDYEGFLSQAQYGIADGGYSNTTISQLAGHKWESGSVLFAYEYHSSSLLTAGDRSFSRSQDLRSRGGTNFQTYQCSPATIAPNNASSSNVYASPYTGAAVATAGDPNSGICDQAAVSGLEPSATQHALFAKFTQRITDKLDFGLDLNYASRVNYNPTQQGTISSTAFGPTGSSPAEGTASRNPFYQDNSATGTSSEFVRWSPQDMIGPVRNKLGQHTASANFTANYDIGSGWAADLDYFAGWNQAFNHSSNVFCTACANLALNGTVNSTGAASTTGTTTALSDTYLLGTITAITRPLNTGNALDVWHPAGPGNLTSATVINELQNNFTDYDDESNLNNLRVKVDGPLFSLPAGDLKIATGGEYYMFHETSANVTSNGSGPTNSSARLLYVPLKRTIWSAFAEFYVPIISPEMDVPLVRKLDFDIAGRYDEYSDVGATRNPRMSFTWGVFDGFNIRGNYGTSFTAPNPQYLSIALQGSVASSTATFTVPPTHPSIYAGSVCPNPNNCSFSAATPGVTSSIGNPDLKPMTGQTSSAGFDLDGGTIWSPLQGYTLSMTYWQVKFLGGLTAVTLTNDLTLAGLYDLFKLAPAGGWTPQSPEVLSLVNSGGVVTTNLPPNIYYIATTGRRNAFNIWASGVDFDTHYAFTMGDLGDFVVSAAGTEKTRFDLQGGPAGSTAPRQDYLNGHNETSTIKATQFEGRADVNWHMDPFNMDLAMNYTSAYWYLNTNYPFNLPTAQSPDGYPAGGFERIGANVTFDLYATYDMPSNWLYGWTEGTRLILSIHNIMDKNPPFHDSGFGNFNTYTTGYDQYNASPIGRLVSIGLQKKW
ncbi:MAG TPA: TonB-dependent receptor [Rhizomicrobium sp.]|nr:TonB-dependent receptor [Rhizomicrobium sp.]